MDPMISGLIQPSTEPTVSSIWYLGKVQCGTGAFKKKCALFQYECYLPIFLDLN